MSRVMTELFYGRPVEPFYPGSHYYPQTVMPHGATGPLLPDVQFRVPMESRKDVEKVKDALEIEGVHGVICDLPSQTVTVSGIVPFHRLLKKLKHVKRKSKLLGFTSPNSPFSPSYGHESFGPHYSSSSSFGSSAYNSGTYRPSYREPFSPPHSYGSSYIPEAYERPYYEDYEDYRPYRSY